MGGSPALIDLGEVRTEPNLDEGLTWLSSHRRIAIGFAALIVAVGTLTAAAPGPRPLVETTIPTRLGDLVFSDTDRYYVIHGGASPADTGRLQASAYALPEARLLGRWRLPVKRVAWMLRLPGGALLLTSEAASPAEVETLGVQETTGRVLWRRSGSYPVGVSPQRGNVLLWTSATGESVGTGHGTLAALAPVSGAVRWSYEMPVGGWLTAGYDGGELTTLAVQLPSGRVEIRDPETGAVTAAAHLGPPRQPSAPPPHMQLVGDLLLMSGAGAVASAYGRERLDLRWTVEIDLANQTVAPCGGGLCVGGHTGGIRMLDPATGRTLWSSDRWQYAEHAGAYLIASRFGWTVSEAAVLDPATGLVLAELGNWSLTGSVSIGVRHDPGTSRAWFGRLDAVRGSVRVLGVAANVVSDCQARPSYVVCRRLDGTVGVWRLPPG